MVDTNAVIVVFALFFTLIIIAAIIVLVYLKTKPAGTSTILGDFSVIYVFNGIEYYMGVDNTPQKNLVFNSDKNVACDNYKWSFIDGFLRNKANSSNLVVTVVDTNDFTVTAQPDTGYPSSGPARGRVIRLFNKRESYVTTQKWRLIDGINFRLEPTGNSWLSVASADFSTGWFVNIGDSWDDIKFTIIKPPVSAPICK